MRRRTLLVTGALAVLAAAWPADARADVASCIAAAEKSQTLRASGRLLEAQVELIACAASSCPTTVRADCVTWLTEVKREIPTVVVQAKNARGEDIADVSVVVDAKPVKESLDGLPIALDPGSRRISFTSKGRDLVEQTVILRQGEHRALSVTLLAPGERAGLARPAAGSGPESQHGAPTVTWVLGGAAVVLAGTGIALWAVGKSEKSDLDDGCGTTSSCAHDDIVGSRNASRWRSTSRPVRRASHPSRSRPCRIRTAATVGTPPSAALRAERNRTSRATCLGNRPCAGARSTKR